MDIRDTIILVVLLIAGANTEGGTEPKPIGFNEPLYEYQLNLHTNALSSEQTITIYDENVKVELEGDYSNCFSADNDKGTIVFKRKAESENCEELKNKIQILLKLLAKSETETISATVLSVRLVKMEFEQSFYSGTYNKATKSLTLDGIKVKTYMEGATFDATNPAISCAIDDAIQATVKCSISETLEEPIEIELNVKMNGVQSSTKLYISVDLIKFSHDSYVAELNVETAKELVIPDLEINVDQPIIELPADYTGCLEPSVNKGVIKLIYTVCTTMVNKDNDVQDIIEIIARNKDSEKIATTTLHLTIKKTHFEYHVYDGKYENKNVELTMKLINYEQQRIDFKTSNENLKCEVSKETSEVKCNLKPTTFTESIVTIRVDALTQGGKFSTMIKLLVESSKETSLEFTQALYDYNWNIETNALTAIKQIAINSEAASIVIDDKDYDECFEVVNVEGHFELKRTDAKCSSLLDSTVISLKLKATEGSKVGRTVVALDIIKKQFEKPIYIGSYKNDKIELETLKLINADDATDIDVKCKNPNLVCSYDETSKSVECKVAAENTIAATFDTIVTASNEKSTTNTKLVIKVISQATDDKTKFTSDFYSSSLNVETKVIKNIPDFSLNSDSAVLKVTNPEYAKCFSFENTKSAITITYNQCEEVWKQDLVILEIAATVETDEVARTHLQLSIVKKHFEKPVYSAAYDNKGKSLHLEMNLENAENEIKFKTMPKEDYFTCMYDTLVKCDINGAVLDGPTKEFSLIAFTDEGTEASTAIVLAVIDSGSTNSIKFLKNYYEGVIDNDELTLTLNEDIELNVAADDVSISDNTHFAVTKDQAKVKIELKGTGPFPKDSNVITVELTATKGDDEAKVVIVFEIKHKPIMDTSVSVPFALVVMEILEEVAEPTTVLKFDNTPDKEKYGYCIKTVEPNEFIDQFSDENGIVAAKKLDREDETLRGKTIPQITLNVKLIKMSNWETECPSRLKRSIIETESIAFSETHTSINVIVLDTNDNKPVFEKDEIVVAYPSKDLIDVITPAKLITVHATDLDDPEKYGKISYEIIDSDSLIINEVTGDILPTEKLYSDVSKEYQIRAYNPIKEDDEDMSAILTLKVHVLDSSSISYISVEKKLEEIDEYLASLSTDDYDVHMLAVGGLYQFASPTTTTTTSTTTTSTTSTIAAAIRLNKLREIRSADDVNDATDSDDGDTDAANHLNIYVYALKKADQSPASNEQLKTILGSDSVQFKDIPKIGGKTVVEEEDTSGLVAAVAVLGVLVAILLLGGIAFWYFKLRHRRH